MLLELRHACRSLRKSPGFTAAAVATLALAIGANSALFSVLDAVLLRALPYPHSERLAAVYATDAHGARDWVAQPDLDDWRAMSHSFDALASWVGQSVNLTGFEEPRRVLGAFVSANLFATLGVAPALGRGFAEGEDRPGGRRVAVLSDRLWRSQFAADPAMLGRSAQFNGEPFTIVGVLPASFVFAPMDADVYLPAFAYPNYSPDRSRTSCAVIGRLARDAGWRAAESELNQVAGRLAAAYPESNRGRGVLVMPLKDTLANDLRPSLAALEGAVAFVLLIGCANVAGLLAARMVSRSKERAVRLALGASRWRLAAHVAAEAVVVSAAGGAAGLLLGAWLVPAMAASLAPYLPAGAQMRIDGAVMLFTLAVSMVSALAIAAIPAWQATSAAPVSQGFPAGRGAGSGARANRSRAVLVIGELALAVALVAGAGLMIKSLDRLGRADPGFDPRNLLMLAYRVPRNQYPTGAQQTRFHEAVVESIRQTPGVLDATAVRAVPLGGNGSNIGFYPIDRPEPSAAGMPEALFNFADPHFFATLRIPVARGRVFEERDDAGAPYVVVINQTLARRYFGDRDPIGRRLRLPAAGETGEIVGVVGDIKQFSAADPPEPQVYGALAQNPFVFNSLAVRTSGDPRKLANPIRRAIWRVDKNQPVWSVNTFEEMLAEGSRPRFLVTGLLAVYAALALLLASIGIFGIVSYSVSQRTGEIGVRMAVGARPADVVRLVLRQAAGLASLGIVLGLAAAAWLSRWLAAELYAVQPIDPAVYAMAAAALATVAMAACLLPARRAARLNPLDALRAE